MTIHDPVIFAHRGIDHLYPDNTFESIAEAAADGIDALELDIQFTADGVPIVHHDESCEGNVFITMTLAEVKAVQLYGGYEIPSLEEILVLHLNSFRYINVDVKSRTGFNPSALQQLMIDYDCFSKIIFSSEFNDLLITMHQADPRFVLGSDGTVNSDNLQNAIVNGFAYALVHFETMSEMDTRLADHYGIRLIVYTIGTALEWSTIKNYYPWGIITDCPEIF